MNIQVNGEANVRVSKKANGETNRNEQGQENAEDEDMQGHLFRERRWDLERHTQLLEAGDLIWYGCALGERKNVLDSQS